MELSLAEARERVGRLKSVKGEGQRELAISVLGLCKGRLNAKKIKRLFQTPSKSLGRNGNTEDLTMPLKMFSRAVRLFVRGAPPRPTVEELERVKQLKKKGNDYTLLYARGESRIKRLTGQTGGGYVVFRNISAFNEDFLEAVRMPFAKKDRTRMARELDWLAEDSFTDALSALHDEKRKRKIIDGLLRMRVPESFRENVLAVARKKAEAIKSAAEVVGLEHALSMQAASAARKDELLRELQASKPLLHSSTLLIPPNIENFSTPEPLNLHLRGGVQAAQS